MANHSAAYPPAVSYIIALNSPMLPHNICHIRLQADVIPTFVGDACLGTAFALHHSRINISAASPINGRGQRQPVPVYLHERGFQLVTEDHYLIAGIAIS